MKVWKIEQYNNYVDEELEEILNKLQKEGASIKEIILTDYMVNFDYGSYKIVYTVEDELNG